jgi:hypothetical protein
LPQRHQTLIMNYTKQQVIQTVLKVLEELDKTDVTKLSLNEKRKLALDKRTTPETLTALSSDKDVSVRYFVAENPNTSPETLTLMSKDKNYSVRYHVAKNPNTSSETLTLMASDGNPSVRKLAKENLNYKPNV